MSIFTDFKEKLFGSMSNDDLQTDHDIDNLISLGVLLWVVADADGHFHVEEEKKIREVLREYGDITDQDMPIVLRSIEEAAKMRLDYYSFAETVGGSLTYDAKQEIVENLYHVALSDGELDHEENEIIRKISGLLRLDHKDFIEAKLKVKKELKIDN